MNKRVCLLILAATTLANRLEGYFLKQASKIEAQTCYNEAVLRDQDGLDPKGLISAEGLKKW